MAAVSQLGKLSADTETHEVSLRGRLPPHHDFNSEKVKHFALENGVVADFSTYNENQSEQIMVLSVVENQHCVQVDLPAFSPSKEIEVHSPLNINDGTTSTKDTDQAYFEGKSIEELRELYLEKLYNEKQGPHEFYCPNCKVCISKVLVYDRDPESPRCTSCFSFLNPAWLFSKPQTPKINLVQDISVESTDISVEPTEQAPRFPVVKRPTRWEIVKSIVYGGLAELNTSSGVVRWEIVKSIVYGGLAESITSLGIVTSAASGDASTLNIVTLAIANLLGGLFVIGHNLWELKHGEPKVRPASDNTEEQVAVDRYEEVLGKKDHFILHAFVAILSFLVFGLVPPVVYGFSFRERNDKDFKLAAVAVASLLCITLLSFAKASTQNSSKYSKFKTVMHYVVVGFGVSGASYLAGELINKLMKKLNLFESTQSAFTLPLVEMVTGKSTW